MFALVALSTSIHSATFQGVWSTQDGDARVSVSACPEETVMLCGRIDWLAEPEDEHGTRKHDIHNPDESLRERPIVGLEILRIDASPDGKGVYRNGTLYDPKSGKTYRCKATIDAGGGNRHECMRNPSMAQQRFRLAGGAFPVWSYCAGRSTRLLGFEWLHG